MDSTLRTRDALCFPSDPAPTPLMEMYPSSPKARYIVNAISNLLTVENLSGQVPRACKRKLSFGTAASHPFESWLIATPVALHLTGQTEKF
jgi:hypothetical protein